MEKIDWKYCAKHNASYYDGPCPVCADPVAAAHGRAVGADSLHRVARRRSRGETLRVLSEIVANTTDAEELTDIQLAECIRAEITDHMPMNTRTFALLAEATERLLKHRGRDAA